MVREITLLHLDFSTAFRRRLKWQVLNVVHPDANTPIFREKAFSSVITVIAGGVVIMEDKTKDVTLVKKVS